MGVATCPKYGTHRMKNLGPAAVRDSNGNTISYFSTPFLYKCDCGEYSATTGYAHFSGYPIGYYCTHGAFTNLGSQSGGYFARVNTNYIYYTSATSLAGYQFIAA
ncbi:MAG: hypothetical protein KBT36_12900 [Kurthia sp.]|nr:hypothetical protein [Candidatus Kurthia equi]